MRMPHFLHLLTILLSTRVEGIDVQIGKRPYARTIRVSQAALKAVPILQRQLRDGARILNVDPDVFEIVLQYIEQNKFLAQLRPGARNPLEQLVGGTDSLLNLAKVWHLGQMLDLVQMQNKLIKIFSINYRYLLQNRAQMQPNPEPFIYLRDHVGCFTRCEKFLIDFYAGLASHREAYEPKELQNFPHEIASELRLQRMYILRNSRTGDRILRGAQSFKVSASDDTRRACMQVIRPSASSKKPSVTLAHAGCNQSVSPTTHMPQASVPAVPSNVHGHRPRLSLPGSIRQDLAIGTPSLTVHLEAAASHTQLHSTLVITTRVPVIASDPI